MIAPTSDRRRSLRVAVIDDLHGRPIPERMTLTVHDVSDEGFSVYAPLAFAAGERYRFEFSDSEKVIGELEATSAHSSRLTNVNGQARYLCGFAVDLSSHYAREVFREVHPTRRATGVGGFTMGAGSLPRLSAFDR